MGWLKRLLWAGETLSAAQPTNFAEEPDLTTVDGVITTANLASPYATQVSREAAMQVPAVARGRNLICSISTLPIVQLRYDNKPERSAFLEQIDPDVPNAVTLAMLIDDMLFRGVGWLHVTERGWNDYPTSAVHVHASRVHMQQPQGAQSVNLLPSGADPAAAVWIDDKVIPGEDMIRFDSPNEPLLKTARKAIIRAVALDNAAKKYASNPRPLGYFEPTDGADPADDDEIEAILTDWNTALSDADGVDRYIPASLNYKTLDLIAPRDLQLAELQQRAALDIANHLGLDPEDLGINVTSRTYQNAVDRRRDRINDLLAQYIVPIEQRLSMGDVTRRGYRVKFDLTDYLKANPKERAEIAAIYHGLGAITPDEIRADDGREPLTAAQKRELKPPPAPAAIPAPKEGIPVQQSVQFSDEHPETVLLSFEPVEFKVEPGKRMVTGTLLPFAPVVGSNGRGKYRFAKGSVQWSKASVSRIKLNREHDRKMPFGAAMLVTEQDTALTASFKLGRSDAASAALNDAEDGILDGLSAEVDILDFTIAADGVMDVTKARLTGAALTGSPAFDDARLTTVAASRTEGNTTMGDTAPVEQTDTAPVETEATTVTLSIDDLKGTIREVLSEDRPRKVSPHRATLSVTEELPYRFDGVSRGEHEFSSDLFLMANQRDGSGEARSRVEKFLDVAFATATTDVDELNPTQNRPSMYVDQLDYSTPIWDAIYKGTIADQTPFTFPKFNSSSGLVGDHTEGTEPSVGSFTSTKDTVTPSPVSGKVEINREVIDMGGNPQVTMLIWNEIKRAWNEALEAEAVALLEALTPTAIALTAGGADDVLEGEIVAALGALQFVRGGARMRDLFVNGSLHAALIAAVDGNGRRLFPILGASNATGTTSGDFGDVAIGSYRARPAWALPTSASAEESSYLFNRGDVWGWATAPRRLDFDYQVKSVFMGVWGYKATVCSRVAGVREIKYDPVA